MSQRKPIFDGVYEVSEDGKVFRVKPPPNVSGSLYPKELKQCLWEHPRKSGKYWQVGVNIPGVRRSWLVHRLVLLAFKGPCPDGYEGAHLNGNSLDNRITNLDYKTKNENLYHKLLHGTTKYTKNQILEVKNCNLKERATQRFL